MRSQASGRAACVGPEIVIIPVPEAPRVQRAATSESVKGELTEGPAGWVACGVAEEDGPVTWEIPDCLWRRYRSTGNRRSSPTRRSATSSTRPARVAC
jgi:hypothetical protein